MVDRLNEFMVDLHEIYKQVTDMKNMLFFQHQEELSSNSQEARYQSLVNIQIRLLERLQKDIEELDITIDDTALEVLQEKI